MKKIEIILVALCVISIITKALFWWHSATLMAFSFVSLSIFYVVASRKLFIKLPSNENLDSSASALSTMTGIVLSIGLISLLFKFLRWPFDIYLTFLSFLFSIILLVVNALKYSHTDCPVYFQIIKRLAVLAAITLIFTISPDIWANFQYRNHPSFLEVEEAYFDDMDNFEAMVKFDYEYHKIHNPKHKKNIEREIRELESNGAKLTKYDSLYLRYMIEDEQKRK